jgi:anti-sigma factor RsiW
MSEARDCTGDAAAYPLGALEVGEAEDFRRHLNSCVVCRDELGAFRHAVDALAIAAPQRPFPPGLRRRVMRAVSAEPSLAVRAPERRRLRLFVPRPSLARGLLAAAVLAIAAGLELAPGGSFETRIIPASVTGSSWSAQLRVAGGHADLIVTHLPPPAAGRIYEVWLEHGSRPPSPTRELFSVTASGAAEVGVPGDVRGVSTIMVTEEPAGGSLVSTHAPVIVAPLT